jgi:hypothetical protein
MIDLSKEGVTGDNDSSETQEPSLPDELMDEEFLDSPVGKIMQALAGLEMAAKAFETRIGQCEQYVMYLLAKDPTMGPKIAAMAKATTETEASNGKESK